MRHGDGRRHRAAVTGKPRAQEEYLLAGAFARAAKPQARSLHVQPLAGLVGSFKAAVRFGAENALARRQG